MALASVNSSSVYSSVSSTASSRSSRTDTVSPLYSCLLLASDRDAVALLSISLVEAPPSAWTRRSISSCKREISSSLSPNSSFNSATRMHFSSKSSSSKALSALASSTSIFILAILSLSFDTFLSARSNLSETDWRCLSSERRVRANKFEVGVRACIWPSSLESRASCFTGVKSFKLSTKSLF